MEYRLEGTAGDRKATAKPIQANISSDTTLPNYYFKIGAIYVVLPELTSAWTDFRRDCCRDYRKLEGTNTDCYSYCNGLLVTAKDRKVLQETETLAEDWKRLLEIGRDHSRLDETALYCKRPLEETAGDRLK